jgi:cysteine synthase
MNKCIRKSQDLQHDRSECLRAHTRAQHANRQVVGFIPPMLREDTYDEVSAVNETDARLMAKRLAAEEGIMAGTSTGLIVVAALKIAAELGPGKNRRHL